MNQAVLPFPAFFVYPQLAHWRDVLDSRPLPSADDEGIVVRLQKGTSGRNHWIVQSYLRLKARGLDVRLTKRFVPGCVNVAHFDDLRAYRMPFRSFVVAVQADRPRPRICDLRIVQNPKAPRDSRSVLLPQWPQPGLIPRNLKRGRTVCRVGYVGRASNLDSRFRAPSFRAALMEAGLEFVVRERDWHRYEDLDVILAVRGKTETVDSVKAPSKLLNSWRAGCPALLGPESSYRALRTDELDYIEVTTPEEALVALARLKGDPELYERMVRHGRKRAERFSPEAMAEAWESMFRGPVAEFFGAWRRRGRFYRYTAGTAIFVARAFLQRRECRNFYRAATAGVLCEPGDVIRTPYGT